MTSAAGQPDSGAKRQVGWIAWQPLWPPVRTALQTYADALRADQPDLRVQLEGSSNPAYPLLSSMSLNVTGPPWDEDVVLSARVWRGSDEFVFRCDIADGDGQILAEVPEASIAADEPEAHLLLWARRHLDDYLVFVQAELDTVRDQLTTAQQGRA
ncbi:hypothetical protein [Microlunatus antarcticus]|uniref:Uncharacterized protein n=1 Tax=Microlunatus antarcticus TaxID=53388 RepID=A0A7W5P5M3_9ACTN|nr:hypothetical protein [Microlunatus antarcticus]MBB3325447.1 hypothetical protein [Microlunatus antarcticus]